MTVPIQYPDVPQVTKPIVYSSDSSWASGDVPYAHSLCLTLERTVTHSYWILTLPTLEIALRPDGRENCQEAQAQPATVIQLSRAGGDVTVGIACCTTAAALLALAAYPVQYATFIGE